MMRYLRWKAQSIDINSTKNWRYMKARRTTLKALAAAITLGFALVAPVANAQDKGTVGVAKT